MPYKYETLSNFKENGSPKQKTREILDKVARYNQIDQDDLQFIVQEAKKWGEREGQFGNELLPVEERIISTEFEPIENE